MSACVRVVGVEEVGEALLPGKKYKFPRVSLVQYPAPQVPAFSTLVLLSAQQSAKSTDT